MWDVAFVWCVAAPVAAAATYAGLAKLIGMAWTALVG